MRSAQGGLTRFGSAQPPTPHAHPRPPSSVASGWSRRSEGGGLLAPGRRARWVCGDGKVWVGQVVMQVRWKALPPTQTPPPCCNVHVP